CRPARKSCRKRAAYVTRYSCAKFVKYVIRASGWLPLLVANVSAPTPNDAVQQQRHVWGTRQSRWSSGGFAVNPGSAWHVGAPNCLPQFIHINLPSPAEVASCGVQPNAINAAGSATSDPDMRR